MIKVFSLLIFSLFTIVGCHTFKPAAISSINFGVRSVSHENNLVKITVAVPDDKESEMLFDVPLYDYDIQPVWIQIENKGETGIWFLPLDIDSNYFSPFETSYKFNSFFDTNYNKEINNYFKTEEVKYFIPAKSSVSGYVYTNLDKGYKYVPVTLIADKEYNRYIFTIDVGEISPDYKSVDFKSLYSQSEIKNLSLDQLQDVIKNFHPNSTDSSGKIDGDPINLVFIGNSDEILAAFKACGWNETEIIDFNTSLKTVFSFLFSTEYKYMPISPLYVYGREQDAGLQKDRDTVNARNHIRLWLTPMKYDGKPILIGQISRDVGITMTDKLPFVTHKIDPDIDGARNYLLQDLLRTQTISAFGFIKGKGFTSNEKPRYNLGGDPYYTDGHILVVIFSEKPVSLKDVHILWREKLSKTSLINN